MYYIRFLKLPTIYQRKQDVYVNAKITITTDLGESFLCFDLPILVISLNNIGNQVEVHSYQWKAGKRDLEISFPLPKPAILSRQQQGWPYKLLVQPRDANHRLEVLADVLTPSTQSNQVGLVLPVLSGELDHPHAITQARTARRRVARHFSMADGNECYIWEEVGESIARHIWDAGLLLSAYLDSIDSSGDIPESRYPEYLKAVLSKDKLHVLELGTGCGIVGITFARRFPQATVLITDMSETEEIAQHNINLVTGSVCPDRSSIGVVYEKLDWEDSLPEGLRNKAVDLILVADCTYNSDVVPDLVRTLADLVKINQNVLILVAMKIRHNSEMVFFELMKERNMVVLDKLVFPLPLLGQDAEEIEFYFFKGA